VGDEGSQRRAFYGDITFRQAGRHMNCCGSQ